jgi:hypothetical protein
MTLSDIERHSALWKKISEHLAAQIDIARKQNDGELNDTQTARLRGKIQAYKELLSIGNESVAQFDVVESG